jgi:hypothetical protein
MGRIYMHRIKDAVLRFDWQDGFICFMCIFLFLENWGAGVPFDIMTSNHKGGTVINFVVCWRSQIEE